MFRSVSRRTLSRAFMAALMSSLIVSKSAIIVCVFIVYVLLSCYPYSRCLLEGNGAVYGVVFLLLSCHSLVVALVDTAAKLVYLLQRALVCRG